jgi:uncharacterized protein with von Willebrand factor type A (vWA) domain
MSDQKGKKRKAYRRKDSGEPEAHKARRRYRRHIEIGSREIKRACEEALKRAGVPVNYTEEYALKQTIKELRRERKEQDKGNDSQSQ